MRSASLLICAVALFACTPKPGGEPCRFRLVRLPEVRSGVADPAGILAKELPGIPGPHVVVCTGDDLTQAVLAKSGRDGSVPLVAVGVGPANLESMHALEGPSVALVASVPPEVALELALLRCYGHNVPEGLSFGPRLWTRNNQAAGGQEIPSPAGFALAALRHQHAAVLAGPPPSDVVFRFGLVETKGNAHDADRRRNDWARAASRFPQIHWEHRQPNGTEATIADLLHFRNENYNVILVDGDGPEINTACTEAVEQGIMVVRLGTEAPPAGSSLWLGTNATDLARGLAQAITEMLPAGGSVIALEQHGQPVAWDAVARVLGPEFCR